MIIKIVSFKHQIKIIGFLGFFAANIFLTGCADTFPKLMNHIGYEPVKKPADKTCIKTDVLITNLLAKPNERIYILPNGHRCEFLRGQHK